MAKTVSYVHAWRMLALVRIAVGYVFVWAFLDKLFGLGFTTTPSSAWLAGGSPTGGFLTSGVNPGSPLYDFFVGLAGQPWVDWLFMLGLLGIGSALMLGIGLRIAAVTGTILLLMIWATQIPLENNPFIDQHIIYALVVWTAAFGRREWSLADWWLGKKAVRKNSWLW